MMYSKNWDLSTIPDAVLASESGRRRRAKATKAPNVVLIPCAGCKEPLNARQRRKPCPFCHQRQPKLLTVPDAVGGRLDDAFKATFVKGTR